ncbi:MAG: hypothetical protein HOG89_02020 [Candidatus Peribacter sp.]|nr:hypothetical protein [Candidatus Peribacter sp.]MBT5937553.1 hypothetical protein [Candidatus Peribacter sp.]MBT7761389.1 hypothetical protein [Candidatus Peribacter sp.]
MKCLLVGNFGVGNLGDEALKDYFLQEFSTVDWTVVSADPQGEKEVARLPGGVRSLLKLQWFKTLFAYRSCDAIVFGGGSLFTDTESVFACILWWFHAQLGFALGKDVHLAFQGVGPFKTRLGNRLAREVFTKARSISVRDSFSYNRVGEWGLSQKCVQTFDPVYSFIESQNIATSTKKVFIVIPRKNSTDKFTKKTQELVSSMAPEEIRIISMQPDKKSEVEYCQKLASTFDIPSSVQKVSTLNELVQQINLGSFVISQRYHGALVALALNTQVTIIPQRDEDKLSSLCQFEGDMHKFIHAGEACLRNALEN